MSMRCRRGEWTLAAVIAVTGLSACTERTLPPPSLSSIEPASAYEASPLNVTIRGDRLFRTADRRLGIGALIDADFRASLDGVPLTDVRWISPQELTARVPDTVPPGTHTLEVEAPNGRAELANAFVVIPVERCGNGTDDDDDALADCADPDCQALACDDGEPCTEGDVCGGGTCSGSPKACTPPSACFSGGCDAGTCGYSVLVGANCADPRPCTTGGICTSDGGCTGTSTCVAPGECWSAQCGADGGCLVTANSGQPCSLGTCDADGGCVAPPSGWSYFPSNFNPAALSAPATAASLTGGCNAVFDTTTNLFAPDCGLQAAVTISTVTLSDNRQASVLAFADLTIATGSSLTLIGQRPAILAVFGNATIGGQVLVNSTTAKLGAGAAAYPAPPGPCLGHSGWNAANSRGGAGGAGYRNAGGSGGTVTTVFVAGPGGAAIANPQPVPLYGGCPGGVPLLSLDGGAIAGPPGAGGGALQISASGEVSISGLVSASGGGGSGGLSNFEGGRGGGSGGTLVVEGDRITLADSAVLTANGGAGGGGTGRGNNTGSPGANGAIATSQVAMGGAGGTGGGGAGGNGAAGATAPQSGAEGSENGGGGGGSAGAIFIRASPSQCSVGAAAVISPPRIATNCP